RQIDQYCEQLNFAAALQLLEQNQSRYPAMAQSKTALVQRNRELHQKIVRAREALQGNRLEEAARSYEEFLQTPPPHDFHSIEDLRQEAESALRQVQEKIRNAQLEQQLKKADVFLRMGQVE